MSGGVESIGPGMTGRDHHDRPDARTRRRIVWTAVALGVLAVAFYVGFILTTASRP